MAAVRMVRAREDFMTPLELECSAQGGDHARSVLDDRALAAFITYLVALATGVGARDIAGATRRQAEAAKARQVAMYLAHTACSWPLARVGSAFGRDRTTAAHACQRVEDMRSDAMFDALVDDCEACVRAAPCVRRRR